MNIKNSIVTFWFEKQDNITQLMDKLNNELNSDFFPFNVVGVPINFDPGVPRMTTSSNGNHSLIEISLISYRLTTNFDDNFNKDPQKCIDYLKDKVTKAFELLKKLDIKILYSAIFITLEKKEKNPIEEISSKFLKNEDFSKSDEIGIRLTNVLENKYYKILSINNNKFIKYTIKTDEKKQKHEIILPLLSLDSASDIEDYLITSVEINDKFAFNCDHTHNTSMEELNEMLDKTLKEIKIEIERF